MKKYTWLGKIAWLLAASAAQLVAVPVTIVLLGTAAPPGSIGGYPVAPLTPDPTAVGAAVTSVGAGAELVSFDNPLIHYRVGDGWSSWSHGFSGSVYWFDQLGLGVDTLTLLLPAETRAVQLYVQPNFLGTQSIGLSAANGGAAQYFGAYPLEGNGGAGGFGFYVAPGSPALSAITLHGLGTFPDGFAVGELGLKLHDPPYVPDNGVSSFVLGGILVLLVAARRSTR